MLHRYKFLGRFSLWFMPAILLLAGFLASYKFSRNIIPPSSLSAASQPQVLDNRLSLSLLAEDPDIVTPIGIAIDKQDRIFVLESHTHLPPKDYKGPAGDVVKIFQDRDGDGKPEKISVFAQGLKEGLNLAFSPDGHLYAVTSRAVWVLYDKNNDGVCEEQVKVAELVEPAHVYAHAALLGVTFSPDGWMYISRGNTGGAQWKMVGKDGSTVSGFGDGGNIFRARPDGSQLKEFATGFWNPVDLRFDSKGRLFTVDNDPDSRGPNRLVHIVPGGDYGYKSLYGGSGIHPYLAWNGELPGTLPYAVALGEAPSGLLNADLAALPKDYQGQMLATIWEESTIVRLKIRDKGVSVTGEAEVIVAGDQQFRPVTFAADSKGNIYFTDWVLRDYPNHGKGRVWKLAAKPGVALNKPRPEYARLLPNPAGKPLKDIYTAQASRDFNKLKEALRSDDPFLRHAAAYALAQPTFETRLTEATRDNNPEVKLGAMLALQWLNYPNPASIIKSLLTDSDERIRQQALKWVGQAGLTGLQPEINKALQAGAESPALFETYLETVKHLAPEFINTYQSKSVPYAKDIKRTLPPDFIQNFIQDKSNPASMRAAAIRYLENPATQIGLLTTLLTSAQEAPLRLEAIRTLANLLDPEAGNKLLAVTTERSNPGLIRAEALLALARQPIDATASIIPLLQDSDKEVQLEAARYLRTKNSNAGVKQALQQKYIALPEKGEEPLREQLALALTAQEAGKPLPKRPTTLPDWQRALATDGDALRGRRVLYSVQSVCAACHAVQGRGGDLGPDLTNVGQSKSREGLISSILRPSEEISPEYQGWFIKLKNGDYHQGRQIDIGDKKIELYTHAAGNVAFAKSEIADYGRIEKSLMPDGLETQLTVSDLRDLIAFLQTKGKDTANSKASVNTSAVRK